jgi:hypothetical protein
MIQTTPIVRRGLALALPLALAALTGCDDAGATTPAAAPTAAAPAETTGPPAPVATGAPAAFVEGPAEIEFDAHVYDFGIISEFETYEASFPFTNTGTGTLVISDIKAACGCTVPTLAKRQYQPGERGEIKIVFDPKAKQGPTRKEITVISNSQRDVTKLEVQSDIRTMLEYDRFQRFGRLELGQPHRKRVSVRYTDPDLMFREVTVNDDYIHAEVVKTGTPEVSEGGVTTYRADIDVVLAPDKPWGLLYGRKLFLTTYGRWKPDADPREHVYDMFLIGEVFGEISSKPAVAAIGKVRGAYRKVLTLRSTGRPFQVLSTRVVESNMPGVQVTVEPQSRSVYRVVVHGDTGRFRGSFKGEFAIETDVPGEELLVIPMHGLIQ